MATSDLVGELGAPGCSRGDEEEEEAAGDDQGALVDAPAGDETSGHVDGNNAMPTLVNGWAVWPSVVQRYYTTHTLSNHQCLHVHSNGVCVLSVAPTHPMLQPPLRVEDIAYRTHDSKNLMQTSVQGKRKSGAVFVVPRDMICTITLSDGSSVKLYACIRGSVIEINHRLIDRPELLGTPEGCVCARLRERDAPIHTPTRAA